MNCECGGELAEYQFKEYKEGRGRLFRCVTCGNFFKLEAMTNAEAALY